MRPVNLYLFVFTQINRTDLHSIKAILISWEMIRSVCGQRTNGRRPFTLMTGRWLEEHISGEDDTFFKSHHPVLKRWEAAETSDFSRLWKTSARLLTFVTSAGRHLFGIKWHNNSFYKGMWLVYDQSCSSVCYSKTNFMKGGGVVLGWTSASLSLRI